MHQVVIIISIISRIPGSYTIFQYRNLTRNLFISPLQKLRLKKNLISTLQKLIYAFVWQENTFEIPFVFDPIANFLGAGSLRVVNGIANVLNDFTFHEKNFQV